VTEVVSITSAGVLAQRFRFGIDNSSHRAIAAFGAAASHGPVGGRGASPRLSLMLNARYRLPTRRQPMTLSICVKQGKGSGRIRRDCVLIDMAQDLDQVPVQLILSVGVRRPARRE
jgi:hypothetical protein